MAHGLHSRLTGDHASAPVRANNALDQTGRGLSRPVQGLHGVYAARHVRTTQADPAADRPTDLVKRHFAAQGGPDRFVDGGHHPRR